jgi:hypothetical protein
MPLGIHTLVQAQHDRVVLLQLAVKHAFHVAVCTDRLENVANVAVLGTQLDFLKVFDIICTHTHTHTHSINISCPHCTSLAPSHTRIIEHLTNDRGSLVNLKCTTSQRDSLQHDAIRIDLTQRATANERRASEDQHRLRWEHDRTIDAGDRGSLGMEEALELVLVGVGRVFRIDWPRDHLAESADECKLILGSNWFLIRSMSCDGKVQH